MFDHRARKLADMPPVVAESAPLSLHHWLQLRWFYPNAFQPTTIIETGRSYVVLSDTHALKFLKSSATAQQNWKFAAAEIRDHEFLAPGLYEGASVVAWDDGEPLWENASPLAERKVLRPEADAVVLRMKRIPRQRALSVVAQGRGVLSDRASETISRRLTEFYAMQREFSSRYFQRHVQPVWSGMHRRHCRQLQERFAVLENFLDPLSRLVVRESMRFLVGFFDEHEGVFFERGRRGLIVDIHGDLRAEHVTLPPSSVFPEQVVLWGRPPKNHEFGRFDDVLSDIAQLVVSLESLGAPRVAKTIEESFWQQDETFNHAGLLQVYKVSAALRRAAWMIETGRDELLAQVPQLLSRAFRYWCAPTRALIICVTGSSDAATLVAESVADLLGGRIFHIPRHEVSQFWHFDTEYKRLVRDGRPLILVKHRLECEEQEFLHKLSSATGAGVVWIDYRGEVESVSTNDHHHLAQRFLAQCACRESSAASFRPIPIQPVLPPLEQAYALIRDYMP